MNKNVGRIDKIIRLILGTGLILLAIFTTNWWGLVGIVLILTAFIGYCPAYG